MCKVWYKRNTFFSVSSIKQNVSNKEQTFCEYIYKYDGKFSTFIIFAITIIKTVKQINKFC